MNFRTRIALLAETLAPGTAGRFLCPACGGGLSQEETLVVTRKEDGGAVYKCHRASCEVSGAAIAGRGIAAPRPPSLKPYTGALRLLQPAEDDFLEQAFNLLPRDMVGVRYSEELKRFMLPVFGPDGRMRGYVARTFAANIHPKALTYRHADAPMLGYIPGNEGKAKDTVVVVEDYFSAAKVASAGFNSVFLNGTHLPEDGVEDIKNFDTVIIALDKGALKQALKIKRRYEGVLKKVVVWKLEDDLKYLPREKIQKAVLDGETDFSCGPCESDLLRRDLLSCSTRSPKPARAGSSRADRGVLRDGSGGSAGRQARPSRASRVEVDQPETS